MLQMKVLVTYKFKVRAPSNYEKVSLTELVKYFTILDQWCDLKSKKLVVKYLAVERERERDSSQGQAYNF